MAIYQATLEKVIDGETVDLNVDIGSGQIEVRRIRLKGIQSQNIFKQYRTGFKGASGISAKLELDRWFYERDSALTVDIVGIEICGRWLGEIWEDTEQPSLNVYMKNLGYRNDDWNKDEQETLKDEWFDGEEVRVPQGDLLPIFHIWGKPVFVGNASTQLQRFK